MKFGIPASSQAEAKLYDETGTEVDEDVSEEILRQTNLGVFLLKLEDLSNGNCIKFRVKCDIALCPCSEDGKSGTDTFFVTHT